MQKMGKVYFLGKHKLHDLASAAVSYGLLHGALEKYEIYYRHFDNFLYFPC